MEKTTQQIQDFIEKEFNTSAIPTLKEYIAIPNTSKDYDDQWQTNGLLYKAAALLKTWVESQNLENTTIEILKETDLSPLIYIEIEGHEDIPGTTLMYGHYDKQPHMSGWRQGLGPTLPVIEDEKLYGRGACDDGYAIFTAVLSVKACQVNGLPHGKVCIIIEGDEESGSTHLPFYFEKLVKRIGDVSLIVCLDCVCMNYDQLWLTTTLRGIIIAKLKVEILEENVGTADASGIVPDSFRIIRKILSRIEDEDTGEVHKDFVAIIPEHKLTEAKQAAKSMEHTLLKTFPWVEGAEPVSADHPTLYLNRTWLPQLIITGQDGLPATSIADDVFRSKTTVTLSMRLPPTMNADSAFERLKRICEEEPPYGAKVTLTKVNAGSGWSAPIFKRELEKSLKEASRIFYNKEMLQLGDGGSIPFMNTLAEKFPKAQVCAMGVLGPGSNAHGPNEFLHLAYTKKLTCCIAYVLATTYGKL